MMALWRCLACMLPFGLWLTASAAHGQSVLPLRPAIDDASGEAAEPEAAPRRQQVADNPYEPVGIGSGGLRLYPSLTIGGVTTSNVGRSASKAEADTGLNLRPVLRVESDWVRHSLTANASGDFDFYTGRNDLNSRDINMSQQLRLDIRRGTTGDIESSYVLSQSGLEDSNVPATAIGYQTEHTLQSAGAVTHDFGPVETRVRAGAILRLFEDVKLQGGGTQSNADRDYVEPSLALRLTYSDPPIVKPYVEMAYAPRIHHLTQDRNGLHRDSDGYTGSLGLRLDSGPIWTGDLALTYLHRNYEDPVLASNSALGLAGNLTWSPSEITRIVASFGTALSETTSATSSGSRSWTAGINATHDIRDNITVSAGMGLELEKSNGGSDVITYDANIGLAWKLNPALAWTAAYDFSWLDAEGKTRDYTEHRVTAGVTLSR